VTHFTHYRSTSEFVSSLSAIVVDPSRSGAVIVRACRVHRPWLSADSGWGDRPQGCSACSCSVFNLLLAVARLIAGHGGRLGGDHTRRG
jgi:hypothetical protein